jgi:hypothetical protein
MPITPATRKAETGRIMVQGQLRGKFSKTPISINKPNEVAPVCDPSFSKGIGRRITFQRHGSSGTVPA